MNVNNNILDLMSKVTILDLINTLILISALVILILTQKTKITKYLNKWRDAKNEDESFHSLVYELNESIKLIAEKQIQHEESIKKLTETVLAIQELNSETTRAGIKEKIERLYRECHPHMTCTDMQLDTLEDLISEYEKQGGNNSFVHTTVQPEMYQWKIIHEIKTKERSKNEL